jgi:hypothetical protein
MSIEVAIAILPAAVAMTTNLASGKSTPTTITALKNAIAGKNLAPAAVVSPALPPSHAQNSTCSN